MSITTISITAFSVTILPHHHHHHYVRNSTSYSLCPRRYRVEDLGVQALDMIVHTCGHILHHEERMVVVTPSRNRTTHKHQNIYPGTTAWTEEAHIMGPKVELQDLRRETPTIPSSPGMYQRVTAAPALRQQDVRQHRQSQ